MHLNSHNFAANPAFRVIYSRLTVDDVVPTLGEKAPLAKRKFQISDLGHPPKKKILFSALEWIKNVDS